MFCSSFNHRFSFAFTPILLVGSRHCTQVDSTQCMSFHIIADECLVCSNDAAKACWHSFHDTVDWVTKYSRLSSSIRASPLLPVKKDLCGPSSLVGSSRECWMRNFKRRLCDAGPVIRCGVPSVFGCHDHTNEILPGSVPVVSFYVKARLQLSSLLQGVRTRRYVRNTPVCVTDRVGRIVPLQSRKCVVQRSVNHPVIFKDTPSGLQTSKRCRNNR